MSKNASLTSRRLCFRPFDRFLRSGDLIHQRIAHSCRNITSTFDNTAAIDVEAQETYLQSQGTDTSEMDETALAQANTGSKVFIASNVKFVDAMEDLKLTCNM